MGYEKLPTRTSYDLAKASDINALMDDIEVLAGNSGNAPGASIQEIFNNIQCLFYPSYKDLKVKPNASNPNHQVDIEWSELRIENRRTVNKSFTLDITTSGALGLSTGSEAVSTWYSIWAGCNDAGETVTAWMDPSLTAPTLPTGYTKKRLIGDVYNNAGGDFRYFEREDSIVIIPESVVVTGGGASEYTLINISSYKPDNAIVVFGNIRNTVGNTQFSLSPTGSTNGQNRFYSQGGALYIPFSIPVYSDNVYYYSAGGNIEVAITGYKTKI